MRRAAFGALTQAYWRPAYHYLRVQWHLEPAKARFRTFLRVCLDRFVQI